MRIANRITGAAVVVAGAMLALAALATAQSSAPATSSGSGAAAQQQPAAQPAPAPGDNQSAAAQEAAQSGANGQNSPSTSPATQSAPGTTPVGGDQPLPSSPDSAKRQLPPCPADSSLSNDKDKKDKKKDKAKDEGKADGAAPGTTPVSGDCDSSAVAVNPEKVIDPGSEMIKIKPGSIEDVSAVGNRDIGARGMGNWYSTDIEI